MKQRSSQRLWMDLVGLITVPVICSDRIIDGSFRVGPGGGVAGIEIRGSV